MVHLENGRMRKEAADIFVPYSNSSEPDILNDPLIRLYRGEREQAAIC
jgi:hypothetical protein